MTTTSSPLPARPPALDYERGPQLGLVAIDETPDGGVCVRVAAHPLRAKQIISATALWTLTAMVAFRATAEIALDKSRLRLSS